MEIERPDLPRLSAWYDRLKEREAFRATVMTSYEPLRGHD
jgi:glutathione S-transferase